MKEAERKIIKHTQRISFPEVIQASQRIGSLQHSRQATSDLRNLKMAGLIRKLHPLLDEMGTLRVGGRLENALMDYDAKRVCQISKGSEEFNGSYKPSNKITLP